jgi:hypothetical protein
MCLTVGADNMPTAAWVWDCTSMRHAALLLHAAPVRAAAWAPTEPRLALCTGSKYAAAALSRRTV